MRVLVIDDEADIAEIVRLTFGLRWPEAEVVTASTGEMGVELVERDAPDLVLLDIGLPDIDGFELCERIRHFSDVPIVILFARHEKVDKVRGLELGADDYVTKPFSHIELLARVRAVMRRSESQRTLASSRWPTNEASRSASCRRSATPRGGRRTPRCSLRRRSPNRRSRGTASRIRGWSRWACAAAIDRWSPASRSPATAR